ncbi:ferritin-like domain-containing protein [Pendulispora brunnea]|uniref:Ferritin-like domain-containing protein n=1 Tax=Pendulispora brunnea TaxID=2905690 RepID=A0ABZ2K0J7_9BACT
MSSESLHEPEDRLSEPTKNMHRAIVSLIEELEAVDWYQQRAEAATDDALRAVLEHNRDEEIEHASMTLEWIRRNNPRFDANLRTYLMKSEPITEIEEAETAEETQPQTTTPAAKRGTDGSLAIGSLKETP